MFWIFLALLIAIPVVLVGRAHSRELDRQEICSITMAGASPGDAEGLSFPGFSTGLFGMRPRDARKHVRV